MNYQHKRRSEGETKKEFYRRLAAIKKKERSHHHKKQLKVEDGTKKQFEEERQSIKIITDLKSQKIKPIKKSNYKQEQKLRNRVAAQQSRHRHRQYVEELQNKIKIYEQLLQQKGLICKSCSKSLLNDNQDTESLINTYNAELSSKQEVNQKTTRLKSGEQQIILQEYLEEQIIRIDNTGATSPFAIFFAVVLVGILGLLIISPENANEIHDTNLMNSLLIQLPGIQQGGSQEFFKNNQVKEEDYAEIEHTALKNQQQISQQSKQNLKTIFENKVAMVCNSSLILNYPRSQPGVPYVPLQFYILFNKSDNRPKVQIEAPTISNTEGQGYKILAHQWQKVQISSCFTF